MTHEAKIFSARACFADRRRAARTAKGAGIGARAQNAAWRAAAAGALLLALSGPVPARSGWRDHEAGAIAFSAPDGMRAPSLDSQSPPPFSVELSEWTFTLTDRPDRPDQGLTVTFLWSRDAADVPAGDRIVAQSAIEVNGRSATVIAWVDREMDWRGEDARVAGLNADRVFKASCHAPTALWSRAQPICDAIVASMKWESAAPVRSPAPTDQTPQTTAPPSGSTQTPTASGDLSVLWIAIPAIAAVGLVLFGAIRLLRRRPGPPPPEPTKPPQEPTTPESRFCPFCGARTGGAALFCGACGKELPKEA